jgi:ATP synthase protein I
MWLRAERHNAPPEPLGSNQNGPGVSFVRGGFVLIHMGLPQRLGFLTRCGPSQYGPRGLGAAEVSRSCLNRRGCAKHGRRRTRKRRSQTTSLDEAALSARFKRLGERLATSIPDRPSESSRVNARPPTRRRSRAAFGSRPSSWPGLVGAAVGWLIDRWLGISPWGMMCFLLLGFAAGFST